MSRPVSRIVDEAENALWCAYCLILQLPPTSPLRLENQCVYASVRDAFAGLSGLTPEEAQASAESVVAMFKGD